MPTSRASQPKRICAFATEGWMIYPLIFVGALSGMAPPAINSIASSRVDRSAQGELAGAGASVNAIATILSPIVMTQTLFYFSRDGAPIHFPGAPFLVAASATLLALLPFVIGMRAGARPD